MTGGGDVISVRNARRPQSVFPEPKNRTNWPRNACSSFTLYCNYLARSTDSEINYGHGWQRWRSRQVDLSSHPCNDRHLDTGILSALSHLH